MEDCPDQYSIIRRLVFFKTISKQAYETRSDFRAVSGDLNLLEASHLLAP
jgi:hypothetical protein